MSPNGHKWQKLQIWQNGQKRTKWSKDPSGGSSGGPFGGPSGGLSGVRPGFPWEVRPGGLEVGARRAPRLLVEYIAGLSKKMHLNS